MVRRETIPGVLLGVLLAVTSAGTAVAQTVPAPGFAGVGARAIGMGGAFVAVADDATGPMWNPAGENRNGGSTVPIGAFGATRNLDADNIQDLIDDLDDAQAGNLGAAQNLFQTALQGMNINLLAAPYTAVGPFHHVNLYANVQVVGNVTLTGFDAGNDGLFNTPGPANVGDTVTASAYASGVGNIGLTYSCSLGEGWRGGVALKTVLLRARVYNYQANLATSTTINTVGTGTNTGELSDTTLSADLGFLYTPEDPSELSFGLVVRDLTQPSLNDQGVNVPLRRQIDVGLATRTKDGWLIAGDIQDLTGRRTGHPTVHLGAEKVVNDWLTLRGGLYQLPPGQFSDALAVVGGVGLRWGSFHLDLATGTTTTEFLAAELGWTF